MLGAGCIAPDPLLPGYDLCTGLGLPKVGLVYQISSPTPLTPNQPVALIRFVIGTGKDDAGGGLHGSDQTVDVLLMDGTSFTETLRHRSEPKWTGVVRREPLRHQRRRGGGDRLRRGGVLARHVAWPGPAVP